MITLVRVVQTSMACPSQWDAWDADDNYYYLRYRHGYGEMRQYKSKDWVTAPFEYDEHSRVPFFRQNPEYIATIAEFDYGDPLDGVIGLEDFARLAGIELSPELMETGFADHLRDGLIMNGIAITEFMEEES